MRHIEYPSIEQFRKVVKNVQKIAVHEFKQINKGKPFFKEEVKMPILTFKGTIKLHGSNLGVSLNRKTGEIWGNSRNQVVKKEDQVSNSLDFIEKNIETFKTIFELIIKTHPEIEKDSIITIFGEWIGQNIQKKVAISQMEKAFVIFDIKENKTDETEKWFNIDFIPELKEKRIFNIQKYKTFEIEIDFSKPQEAITILETLTNEVDKKCPFAEAHGIEGIGEGIVWRVKFKNKFYSFKTKGQNYTNKRNTNKIADIEPETMKTKKKLVKFLLNPGRMEQAKKEVFGNEDIDREKLGNFIKWVMKDIIKEDSDVIKKNNFDMKKFQGLIVQDIKSWFFKEENIF